MQKMSAILLTVLNLCVASAVCSSHIITCQTLQQHQMWHCLSSSLSEYLKKELLEGPISLDGLCSPHFQSVMEKLQMSLDKLEPLLHHRSLVGPLTSAEMIQLPELPHPPPLPPNCWRRSLL
ncbi:hypothetical protein ILYODFUR_019579 [Ilyodon furcidens]|uniref:Uncharacterized protein n=1 Tax=Ilyodon furcidens TaxID=33524 RepID=A0ABV0TXM8_9TELE